MSDTIKRGMIQKPGENSRGDSKEAIIVRGSVRVPGSSFDHRADSGPAPAYLGPSKLEGRSSAIKGGKGQSKKHKSTSKGQ